MKIHFCQGAILDSRPAKIKNEISGNNKKYQHYQVMHHQSDYDDSFDHVCHNVSIDEQNRWFGVNRYRFVAAVNKTFLNAYSTIFPNNQTTLLDASTLEKAKICLEEGGRVGLCALCGPAV